MIESFTIFSGVVALLSCIKEINHKLILFWLIILPMALLDGLRWEMGTDWIGYYDYFIGDTPSLRKIYDPGFVLFTDFIKFFTDNYSVYLLSISLITFVGIFYGVFLITGKNFLAIFYLVGTLPWYMGSLRQMIACVFFVWALKAIVDREPLKYIVLMIIGISFHATLMVFLLTYIFFGISTISYILLYLAILIGVPFIVNAVEIMEYIMQLYGFNKKISIYIIERGSSVLGTNPILGFTRKILTISGLFIFSIIAGSSNQADYYKWQKIKFFLALSSLSIVFYYIGTYQIIHVASRVDLYVSLIATSILIGLIDSSISIKTNRFVFYLFVLTLVVVFYSRLSMMDLFHPYSSIFYNYDLHRTLH